jgi:hypothetical protein
MPDSPAPSRGLPSRFARSLLFDFVLPWLASATCIVAFCALVFTFGLVAWPIAFGIFLALCIANRNAKADEAQRRHDATLAPEDVLAKYAITVDDGRFVFDGVRYGERADAIVVARNAYIRRGGHWVA